MIANITQEHAFLRNAWMYFSSYAEYYRELERNVLRHKRLESRRAKLNWEPLNNDFKRIRKEEYLMAGIITAFFMQPPMEILFRLLRKDHVPMSVFIAIAILAVLGYHVIKKKVMERWYSYLSDQMAGVIQNIDSNVAAIYQLWFGYMERIGGGPVFIEPFHTDPEYLKNVLRVMEKEHAGCQAVTSVLPLPEYMQYVFYEFEKFKTAYMENHQS